MKKRFRIKWQLMLYDFLIIALVAFPLLLLFGSRLTDLDLAYYFIIFTVCVYLSRLLFGVYRQIWRYGGIQCYIRLLFADAIAFILIVALELSLPIVHFPFSKMLAVACMNALCALTIRMFYRYAYKCGNQKTKLGKTLNFLLRVFAGRHILNEREIDRTKARVAIIGAGRVGASLSEELMNNASSEYQPSCFVDVNDEKVGRAIQGLPVLPETEETLHRLKQLEINTVVLAIPGLDEAARKRIYSCYREAGFQVKIYDYPSMETADGKRHLREFDIEDLLFRKAITINEAKTAAYYRNKVILVTGGGGSIGSELCRQLANMEPKQIIILDICENGAYEAQQDIRIAHDKKVDVRIEIVSITNRKGLARVFESYHPQIVINAAAHKHVPLMEHNCVEAIENNVFGTRNLIELCEEYGSERFLMVSTDKAVNPTNVMGATKRMCEMMVMSASTRGRVKYSATRFGNVLGSAGSVIPLFKKQIAAGGPVTVTDKRIIRYFMTIAEASQLVLTSGAMANNGELFVLDMGQPVRIYELAENMIRLSGVPGIEIVETGLRPGEKLYEELLVKTEELDKTENSLIFIEKDAPLAYDTIEEKLQKLESACALGDDDAARQALREVVPTFRRPEDVNREAANAAEMQACAVG